MKGDGTVNQEKGVQQERGIGMVNGVQQETAYCAVVVNDHNHMYSRPYIIFDPKGS